MLSALLTWHSLQRFTLGDQPPGLALRQALFAITVHRREARSKQNTVTTGADSCFLRVDYDKRHSSGLSGFEKTEKSTKSKPSTDEVLTNHPLDQLGRGDVASTHCARACLWMVGRPHKGLLGLDLRSARKEHPDGT